MISEESLVGGALVEQMVIRNLPDGTKAALRARAASRGRSVEAEVRQIVADALASDPVTLVDLLAVPDDGLDFEPERLGLRARDAEL
ncbi:MAG: Arc family DNA-binding protein [Micrococcales bacterium]|nr:Arc family DNA-binding protein [Micrococcales bacterium]